MNIEEKIIEVIKELANIDEIELDENIGRIGIDSLKTVELVISLEDVFGVTFDDSELDIEKLRTVEQIAEFVKRYTE